MLGAIQYPPCRLLVLASDSCVLLDGYQFVWHFGRLCLMLCFYCDLRSMVNALLNWLLLSLHVLHFCHVLNRSGQELLEATCMWFYGAYV